jgi:hypothetical protein
MRTLEMTFNTELGKTKVIRVYEAKEALTGAEVAAAMDSIIDANIFSGTGGNLTGKIKAQVITTTSADMTLV